MYVHRHLQPTLSAALAHFPAVLVTGPRQAGKTTFLRAEAPPNARYVTFDDPLIRAFAVEDPNGLLDREPDRPLILDEVQYVPEILPHLKIRIDRERDRYGRYLLTGSQRFPLMQGVTESLAGRVAVLDLLPFSFSEAPALADEGLEQVIWRGGYPDPVLRPAARELWISSYVQTYVERDVRQVRDIQNLRTFEQFLGLCAARHGGPFELASLARDCGVSQPTARGWGSVLEASYLAALVPPYERNYGKRLTRTPRLYFLDPALVCAWTRQPSAEAALAGAMGGALFEGLIVAEALKGMASLGRRPDLWFWRSHDGVEVDLLVGTRHGVVPVEIKLSATPSPHHLEPMAKLRALAGKELAPGLLVCRVAEPTPMPGGALALPWRMWPDWLRAALL